MRDACKVLFRQTQSCELSGDLCQDIPLERPTYLQKARVEKPAPRKT